MTRRTEKANNTTKVSAAPAVGLDPRIVELVRFMARCAAKHDYEAMLEAAKNKDKILNERNEEP